MMKPDKANSRAAWMGRSAEPKLEAALYQQPSLKAYGKTKPSVEAIFSRPVLRSKTKQKTKVTETLLPRNPRKNRDQILVKLVRSEG